MSDQKTPSSISESDDKARDKAQKSLREMRLNTPMFAYAPVREAVLPTALAHGQ